MCPRLVLDVTPRKGVPAGCLMNPLLGWPYVSLCKIRFFCLLLPASISPQTSLSPPLPGPECQCSCSSLPCPGSLRFAGVSRATHAQIPLNVPQPPSISGAGRGIPVARSSKGEVCPELQDGAVMLWGCLVLAFCLHCTQVVLTLCFQPSH